MIGLRANIALAQDQILTSPVISTFEDVIAHLVHISSNQVKTKSSMLAISKTSQQRGNQNGKAKDSNPIAHLMTSGHTRDTYWALHKQPPRKN